MLLESQDISIGDNFKVKRLDGKECMACIVESRLNERNEIEYFVHYIGFDRRLDEWVPQNRIDLTSKFPAMNQPDGVLQIPGLSDGRLTRTQKRRYDELNNVTSDLEASDSITRRLEREHQEFTRVKFIDQIRLGKYEIRTWYFSPYPEDYRRLKYLWICEYCLKYMKFEESWIRHMLLQCKQRQPPGKLIYKNGNLLVFEIDGQQNKLYCQNLCLLAKLFLDHKTLYYDVSPFIFYVLCEAEYEDCHIVGYFSKEKVSAENNNLACILTFPPFQRRGYGKFLITFSYELAKRENLVGSPEKPLSDLGRLSYKSYWEEAIFKYILEHSDCTIEEISTETYITPDDIIWTLQSHRAIKYWRHGCQIELNRRALQEFIARINQRSKTPRYPGDAPRSFAEFDSSCLRWTPAIRTAKSPKKN